MPISGEQAKTVLSVDVVQENGVPTLELDDKQLANHLKEALQSWPLYRRLEYTGADKVITVPQFLTLYCPFCELESSWHTNVMVAVMPRGTQAPEKNKQGFCTKQYKCRNCGRGSVIYYF